MSDLIHNGRFRWVVISFMLAGLLTMGMLGWQLYETTPARWCSVAAVGSPEIATGCVNILLKLLDLKQTAVMGLLLIVGLTVISLAAVALRLNIKATAGAGGFSADIGADKTVVSDGDNVVTIPTPPSGDNQ